MPKNLKLNIKLLKRGRLAAFSLLEMIITLFIATTLLLIGTLQTRSFEEQLLFTATVRQVTSALEQAGRTSITRKTEINASHFSSGTLSIYGEHYRKDYHLDPRVKVYNLQGFHISQNGISAPRTLIFSDQRRKKVIKLQMAWGRMIYE